MNCPEQNKAPHENEHRELFSKMPDPPAGSVFQLKKIDTVTLPHPYCITPRHVEEAADHFCGRLGKEAILSAERKGARCDICRQQHMNLSYEEHESMLTLFIAIPAEHQKNLNGCPGLVEYLTTHKEEMEKLGIQGFAFPALP